MDHAHPVILSTRPVLRLPPASSSSMPSVPSVVNFFFLLRALRAFAVTPSTCAHKNSAMQHTAESMFTELCLSPTGDGLHRRAGVGQQAHEALLAGVQAGAFAALDLAVGGQQPAEVVRTLVVHEGRAVAGLNDHVDAGLAEALKICHE